MGNFDDLLEKYPCLDSGEEYFRNAIKKAKEALKSGTHDKETIEYIFPHLAESTDEKIRNAIITLLKEVEEDETYCGTYHIKKYIAWLEKQCEPKEHDVCDNCEQQGNCVSPCCVKLVEKNGEQKPITFNNAHLTDSALNDYCCKQYDALHKENGGVLSFARLQHLAMDIYGWCKEQGQQKPADKVEPKFKVGDWVVVGDGRIGRIIECTKDFADVDLEFSCLSTGINNIRSWTIQDAKDGDVLCTKNKCCPFIYDKGRYNNGLAYYYAGIDASGNLNIKSPHNMLAHFGKFDNIRPATQEQRDLLFKKMREAGYKWDADKKELRKVEPNPVIEMKSAEESLGIDSETYNKIVDECIHGDLEKTSAAWSEADETAKNNISHIIRQYDKISKRENKPCYYVGDCLLWMQNIKDRVLPQPKQEWSEKDNTFFKAIIRDIENIPYISEDAKKDRKNWLKNIKDRVQPQFTWKPSEEQIEALDEVYKTHGANNVCRRILFNLMNDLKKLREEAKNDA